MQTHIGPPVTGTSGHDPRPASRRSLFVVVTILLILAAVIAVFGILRRRHSSAALAQYTDANSAPPVSLTLPVLSSTASEIVLPGNMQAFVQAPIYARTAGYVKGWYHDIGSHVTKGELLATIETPELDQQLDQARADLATAQANVGLAKVTANRYKDLIGSASVSQQDTDNAVSALDARVTQVASAQANVRRLEELQSFERIEAPFDGVITARNLDIGQLITATGSTTTASATSLASNKEVFDISAIGTLRVFLNVPQVYSPDARNGVVATLTVPQYPGRAFQGRLVRSADSVDPTTRTLLAEVDVPNGKGELLPGSYTEVHLHLSHPAPALIVPVSALILDASGLHVAIVDGNSRAHIVSVTPGRDSGSTIEILSGIEQGQRVIANPPDSLIEGEPVRIVGNVGDQPSKTAEAKR